MKCGCPLNCPIFGKIDPGDWNFSRFFILENTQNPLRFTAFLL